ncbi:hypothetical protein FM076_25780 [Streptomyces albus subsp. chlorinus]|uniref:Gfo/Idh/MocA family protein n=1 Tax=Streptomyces albus TaxID=1888 RepID=UPI0015706A89|nr:Gfo/Idh/MocA family oxidoreductase [Streptomyces albus]NSC24375.1 hypothetical protein [Streptomyces albus subsp. chlorinus]
MRPLIVGLGRSGAGLHLKALTTLHTLHTRHGAARDGARRDGAARDGAPGDGAPRDGAPPLTWPPLACDPRPEAARGLTGVTVTTSLKAAASLTEPRDTVVHLCTPPSTRTGVLTELAELGFTRVLVEKPLAGDVDQLDAVVRLREAHGLDLTVVAHWLAAGLTRQLRHLVAGRRLGTLLAIDVVQHKPRFSRTLATHGHPTAFDVEVPHALGVVLDLAGPAELVTAHCGDMVCDSTVVPRMGSAALTLRHQNGVRTEIVSDLTSPVRQRSFTLRFTQGTATAHYPVSDRDDHAQLILTGAVEAHRTFRDDALAAFLHDTYRRFAQGRVADFALHHTVARLLCEAKSRCHGDDGHARTTAAPRTTAAHPPRKDAHAG